MKARIYVLYTGGTIGMGPKDASDPQSPLEPKSLIELLRFVPHFSGNVLDNSTSKIDFTLPNGNSIELNLDSIEPIDSSNISPAHWQQIAIKIRDVYECYDGFIILHGTDTLAYTSSALSFMFENLAKPVVLTGSQLPIANSRTDAVLNLTNAIYIAGHKATQIPLIPEVVIVFADKILRGNRATKISSNSLAGFDSPNYPPLGTLGEHIVIDTDKVLPQPSSAETFRVNIELEENIFDLTLFPGIINGPLKHILLDQNTQAIVIRTYGAGNAPSDDNFLQLLTQSINGDVLDDQNNLQENKIQTGRVIISVSQCIQGRVEMGLYDASNQLQECGVISGFDMTPEATLTKLMWTLGSQFGEGRITQMQTSQRGEQAENLFKLRYGSVGQNKPVNIFTFSDLPDGRLDRDHISRSVLHLTGLGVEGAEDGELIELHVFMNMPRANHDTPLDEERRVAIISFKHDADNPVQTRMQNITYKTQNIIGNGDVILTLVTSSPNIKVFFKGLYLSIYAKA